MAKKGESERQFRLKLICQTPPQPASNGEEILFGLQVRKFELEPGQLQADGSLLFEFEVGVVLAGDNKQVRYRGPYVQGTANAPFVYLSLRQAEVEPVSWLRRLKIPLPLLSWEQLEELTTLPCYIGRVSGNSSGTVPLLDGGWLLQAD